jgi:hypothetical protein
LKKWQFVDRSEIPNRLVSSCEKAGYQREESDEGPQRGLDDAQAAPATGGDENSVNFNQRPTQQKKIHGDYLELLPDRHCFIELHSNNRRS